MREPHPFFSHSFPTHNQVDCRHHKERSLANHCTQVYASKVVNDRRTARARRPPPESEATGASLGPALGQGSSERRRGGTPDTLTSSGSGLKQSAFASAFSRSRLCGGGSLFFPAHRCATSATSPLGRGGVPQDRAQNPSVKLRLIAPGAAKKRFRMATRHGVSKTVAMNEPRRPWCLLFTQAPR